MKPIQVGLLGIGNVALVVLIQPSSWIDVEPVPTTWPTKPPHRQCPAVNDTEVTFAAVLFDGVTAEPDKTVDEITSPSFPAPGAVPLVTVVRFVVV